MRQWANLNKPICVSCEAEGREYRVFPRLRPVICVSCEAEGREYRVFPRLRPVKIMGPDDTSVYWDEEGTFVNPDAHFDTSTIFECSNGHKWSSGLVKCDKCRKEKPIADVVAMKSEYEGLYDTVCSECRD